MTQFGVIAALDIRSVFVSTLLTNTLIGPDKRKSSSSAMNDEDDDLSHAVRSGFTALRPYGLTASEITAPGRGRSCR